MSLTIPGTGISQKYEPTRTQQRLDIINDWTPNPALHDLAAEANANSDWPRGLAAHLEDLGRYRHETHQRAKERTLTPGHERDLHAPPVRPLLPYPTVTTEQRKARRDWGLGFIERVREASATWRGASAQALHELLRFASRGACSASDATAIDELRAERFALDTAAALAATLEKQMHDLIPDGSRERLAALEAAVEGGAALLRVVEDKGVRKLVDSLDAKRERLQTAINGGPWSDIENAMT